MSTKGYYYLVLNGHLKAVLEDGVMHWRFAEEVEAGAEPKVHPINHGDMLKIFDNEQTLVWSGVVAFNHSMCSEPDPDDPEILIQKIGEKVVNGIQGSARPKDWLEWFERGQQARLEIRINGENAPPEDAGAEDGPADESEDPAVRREKLIKEVLQAHDTSSSGKHGQQRAGDQAKHWWDD
jgi:hypothetical protein